MNMIVEWINTEVFWRNIAYICAIALQLAAGLLLIGSTNTKREGIIKSYCEQNRGIAFYPDGALADDSGLRDIIKMTWTNKIAFSYLFAGYLIGIWGEVPINRENTLIYVLLLMFLLWIIAYMVAKHKSSHFGTITQDDIPKDGGVITVMINNDTDRKGEK